MGRLPLFLAFASWREVPVCVFIAFLIVVGLEPYDRNLAAIIGENEGYGLLEDKDLTFVCLGQIRHVFSGSG